MRMLDVERETSVSNLQLYLTQKEATELIKELSRLLKEPEANEHLHIFSEDMDRETRIQPASATPAAWKTSAGVLNPRHFLGRLLSQRSTDRISCVAIVAKSVFLGKNLLTSPMVFSTVPRSQLW